ncbi:hypothetical protein P872_21190 [Rhodonellum psychrophilum GCM71 = DSM 17998]|uniref:Uncharacterized protein n=1 Tax=Rhodonellum psychrophilum GCM71 = DSM 17998 TaxID=1123057 RepID=U5BTB4_9BACT|nr:hypothetical protein P872_21190 [Rhodonellum psychrophilum GCM71 = DSM 17998]
MRGSELEMKFEHRITCQGNCRFREKFLYLIEYQLGINSFC